MMDYAFTVRALRDLEAARAWYDRRSIELGNQFIDDVLHSIRLMRERPMSFPEVEAGVRAMRCDRFPYRIYFIAEADRVVLQAIYHTSRDARRWSDRERE